MTLSERRKIIKDSLCTINQIYISPKFIISPFPEKNEPNIGFHQRLHVKVAGSQFSETLLLIIGLEDHVIISK